jgi:hypothetical protein
VRQGATRSSGGRTRIANTGIIQLTKIPREHRVAPTFIPNAPLTRNSYDGPTETSARKVAGRVGGFVLPSFQPPVVRHRMKTGIAILAGLALLAGVSTAAAQSKGYRPPPPPPPPMPQRSAPVVPSTSPSRLPGAPPSRPQGSTTSGPTSPVPKPSAPPSGTKGGSPRTPTDYAKLNSAELQKAIGSHTRQIDALRLRVNNPRANYPNWDSLSREQQGALLRQWNGEIRRQEASRATAQGMLSQRPR